MAVERDLRVDGAPVATYVVDPDLDVRLAPRPYLHPVRTLGGVTVTDALCFDHPWHLGASIAVADVAGVNLWGGRTYVRGAGYQWCGDHGRITHHAWRPSADGLDQELHWCDAAGRVLLTERRGITAEAAPPYGWRLRLRCELAAADDVPVVLGSPATHGRSGGAGYGGFLWRAGPGAADTFTARHRGAGEVNGSAAPWVALTVADAYTLVLDGLAGADRWFVRTAEYAGVCAAWAFRHTLTVGPGAPLRREVRVLVADGTLTRDEVARAQVSAAPGPSSVPGQPPSGAAPPQP
ncbi:PmoA family protein [Mangrovihabitans endophyticus]|uniref:Oxidoreductase n=1 Tax=Mangrovihabitans endophyticus TaxID=1751298 RepID=A0A8J3FLP1_9ACTN|nr:PmoA family protein [Mangrovihabitans endophyticus]GGK77351.1 oxidoreductase [Mangrovihabitans endophyticus]